MSTTPKRSWIRRHPIWSAVIIVVVLMIIGAAIGGSLDEDDNTTPEPTRTPTAASTPEPTPQQTPTATPEPTPAPTALPDVPAKLAATPEPTLDVERLVCDARLAEIGDNGGMVGNLMILTGEYLELLDLEGAQRAYNEAAAMKSQFDVDTIRWFGDCANLYDDDTIDGLDDAIYQADLGWANMVDICRQELEIFGFDC